MGAAVAVAQAVLALLPMVTTGAEKLWDFITHVRTATQQTGEWTPAAEAAWQAALLAKADSAAAQPDAD